MPEKVEAYLKSKFWTYSSSSGSENFTVQTCPICQDERGKFGIHKTLGLWQCFHCDRSGNLYTLKRELGDISEPKPFSPDEDEVDIPLQQVRNFTASLMGNPQACQYLQDRGLDEDTVRHFQLGLGQDQYGKWLTIPYLSEREGCQGIKFRSLPPQRKAFKITEGAKLPLFNQDAIKDESTVLLTEGEFDCLTLWQMGYRNCVSVPNGAGNFKPEHWDTLSGKKRIYILFDNDRPGKKGAKKIAERLDASRCYEVLTPGCKDVNEFYGSGGTKEQLDYLIENAKAYGKRITYSIAEALLELGRCIDEDGEMVNGPVYPWQGVRELFGPMGKEEMTVVLGPPGVGKTSYILQVLTYAARYCSTPAYLLCLEMPIGRLSTTVIGQVIGADRKHITSANNTQAMIELIHSPLYLARRPPEMTWESVRELLVSSIRRFGIEVWAFDNVQYLCRGDNMVQEVGKVSRELKMLAEETGTHCIVVSHQRKGSEKGIATQSDAIWSQALSADADAMHAIYRKLIIDSGRALDADDYTGSSATYEAKTIIHAAKSRYSEGGGTRLEFNGPCGRFDEFNSNS